jgi:hypothetical protein
MTALLFVHDKGKTSSEVYLQKGIFGLFKIAGKYNREIYVAKIDSGIPR